MDRFNRAARSLGIDSTRAVRRFLTRESLEPTLANEGVPAEIDLLSIDVDGNDFWFWEAIERVPPRVVVVEYNAALGPDLALTMPYAEAGRPTTRRTTSPTSARRWRRSCGSAAASG